MKLTFWRDNPQILDTLHKFYRAYKTYKTYKPYYYGAEWAAESHLPLARTVGGLRSLRSAKE
jgi:hypothetical protein